MKLFKSFTPLKPKTAKQNTDKKSFKQSRSATTAKKFFYGDKDTPTEPSGENHTLGNGVLGKLLLGRSN